MASPAQPEGSSTVPTKAENPVVEASAKPSDSPSVRFSSTLEEIEPHSLDETKVRHRSTATDENIRELSETLKGTGLQGGTGPGLQSCRMGRFNFEPVSLPVSRVHSNEDTSREASRHNTQTSSGRHTPRESSTPNIMHSPPLTPAASKSHDGPADVSKGAPLRKLSAEAADGPQLSKPETSASSTDVNSAPGSRPGSSGQLSTRPTTHSAEHGASEQKNHRGSMFSLGGVGGESGPSSRDASPSRSPAPTYSRPLTPAGDVNDPYAANKRPPQTKNLDQIEPRFVFSGRSSRPRQSPTSSSSTLPRSSKSGPDMKTPGFLASKKDPHLSHLHDDSSATITSKHGSMSELKRFFRLGGHNKAKRAASPSSKAGTKTPPHHKTPHDLPFGDDHGLNAKYGKFGKVLGAGAGGSVRLMKRSSDGVTFAVKEFRARHTYETEKEYSKKVTAEFCVGSSLHHCNIIETLDIVQEKGRWYEVMEYAPFDLFAIVMTGKMSREEVTCSFLQILSGLTYLHSMGLAHRDMKLDNVVVNEFGIMKIIDFGSASVFKYPFENEIVLASGIVGSDPYLAPEVYDEKRYDPQPADIWSLAIIYCCMTLRRFPWKLPRMSDNSYKLFASPPSPGTDMRRLSQEHGHSKSTGDVSNTTEESTAPDQPAPASSTTAVNGAAATEEKKPEVIKGPWRLLRLMPRESRHIIGRMLDINPKTRATLAEILEDPWVANTQICRQLGDGRGEVVHAPGHTHTLEPPAPAPAK